MAGWRPAMPLLVEPVASGAASSRCGAIVGAFTTSDLLDGCVGGSALGEQASSRVVVVTRTQKDRFRLRGVLHGIGNNDSMASRF